MEKIKILWADDEIDLLKPHILFLEDKGYEVLSTQSGDDALDILDEKRVDIVFLDENMPGLSGLETLERLKLKFPALPVIMITKSEEEYIMEDAIGSKISDYLIKPVNPNQILLSIKKNLNTNKLVNEKSTSNYQKEFREIGMQLNDNLDKDEWVELFKKLVYWELELEKSKDSGMEEVFLMQKTEATKQFGKFIEQNYIDWLSHPENSPVMSHNLMNKYVFPEMKKDSSPLFFVVIDNLRYDQWKTLRPILFEDFWIDKEDVFYSILPTTTQYSRNAMFAGMMPSEIERRYPDKWVNDEEEGGRNLHERFFIEQQLERNGFSSKITYNKVLNVSYGQKVLREVPSMFNNQLNIIVYNFVDMLSHARTDIEIIKEIAADESAYRSVVKSWFEHSTLLSILKEIAARGGRVIITTDHGSVRVKEPSKIVGDKDTNTNLRYKQGKSLVYQEKEVFAIKNPNDIHLPKVNVSQSFVFAKDESFFAYPNNYNHYVNYYKDTFQHGGISLDEMLIPVISLSAKK
ncbi:MAG: two-component system response regulator [Flavobacteriales bacterium CG18_big_fil_WC_8_21_14_2_50_32_9]|nr:MAG: two-component system response regulator [Flavobacteriales bacterium CG18_big_fil_WC_8_21_14_2_50_32_9]PJC61785.1 MAG: two-component system response regulator [Flavobacteriales bacterium CG_4_9_14_0_2_um_filter_32_27]